MENPTRTAQYLAVIEERRAELRAQHARILPPKAHIVWEIGCGHGHFLASYAQVHPDKLCVGVDITGDRIERANRKRDRAKLTNLHFVHAEARAFLETLPAEATFSEIFVLFPDPWPKSRHHKHRIMQSNFLAALARRAGEGTRLYFRTDYQPYFAEVNELIRDCPDWASIEEPWPFEQETVFQSRATQYSSLIAKPRQSEAQHKLAAEKTCRG